MIDNQFVCTMARYNQWQNDSLYQASDKLGVAARTLERGAFFGSIHKTLSHVLWGDMLWTSRFAKFEPPSVSGISHSAAMVLEWDLLQSQRKELDEKIIAWAEGLSEGPIEGDISWFSGAINQDVTRPLWEILVGFFNHQTHHRGQVHAMITDAGGVPDDTDLFVMSTR